MTDNLLAFAQELETRGNALSAAAALIRGALGPMAVPVGPPPALRLAPPAPAKKTRAKLGRPSKKKTAPSETDAAVDRKARRQRIVALIGEGKNDAEIARLTGASAAAVAYHRKKKQDTASPRQ